MRELTTVEEIQRMPLTAVIVTPQQYVLERLSEGWFRAGQPSPYTNPNRFWLPAKVLREREEPTPDDGSGFGDPLRESSHPEEEA